MTEPIPVVMTAIIAVAALEVVAIVYGLDGTTLGLAMTVIGGLGGYMVGEAVCAIRAARKWYPPPN